MAGVVPFSRGLIERYVQHEELKFLKDSDGDYVIPYGYSDGLGCALRFLLMATGQNEEIYAVVVHSDRRIPREDWGKAILLCNTWNTEKRWPKAYLKYNEDESTGSIILEEQIDLEDGVHPELFDAYTRRVMACAVSFWEWAHEEQGL